MFDWKLPTHRRGFLGSVAGGAAALGLTSLAHPLELVAATGQVPAHEDPGLTAWLGKITGKHKIVYDTPEPNNGFAFAWSRVFYLTNNETGVADKDISVVIILRHNAIPFAMTDPMWDKYKTAGPFTISDPATNAPSTHNFLYKAAALPLPGMGIDQLLAAGVLIGVLARRRPAAIGGTLAAWLCAAVLYDLVAIGLLQLTGSGEPGRYLVALLALNPVDGMRAPGLVTLGADVLLGPTGAAMQRAMGPGGGTAIVLGSLVAWCVFPIAAAIRAYAHRDF